MEGYLDQLIAFVSAHAWLAYLTVFLAALLEAVPVFGSVVPGSTLIFAISGLVAEGRLDLVAVLGVAMAGALIGDNAAFAVGHVQQRRILAAWPLSRYPGIVAQSETFFHRFGSLAVFFARFVPPVRAFVPITAGALGMSPRKFVLINVPAVVLWAFAHVLPGVVAVTALEHSGGLAGLEGSAHRYWMPTVIVGALTLGAFVWWRRRRRGINIPASSS
jgi:membrane-associated protein